MKNVVSSHEDFADFPVGTPVKIVTLYCDSYFFYGETGAVIRNDGDYLGVIVQFDCPRKFTDGHVQKDFNFNPDDLIINDGRKEPLFYVGAFGADKKLIPEGQEPK